jgi:mono/diheme cytochrome c family protein
LRRLLIADCWLLIADRLENTMKRFLLGSAVGIVLVFAGTFTYVHYGFINLRADLPENAILRYTLDETLDHYSERYAPPAVNPVPVTDANLIDGVRLYKTHCALCHGGPDKAAAEPVFSPRASQFQNDAPDDPENQNLFVVKYGVRMTGMPAYYKVLSETDMWKALMFSRRMQHIDQLPPAVQAAWRGAGEESVKPQAPSSKPQAARPGR